MREGGTDLVNLEIWIGRDDSSSTEVDTLSTQVTTESTLFPLESLTESTDGLLTLWSDAVSVEDDGRG